jgi:hypothetical protein
VLHVTATEIEKCAVCGCPLWVKSRHHILKSPCPLYPQKRTFTHLAGAPTQEFLVRHPLATVVEDDNAGADEFCAPTEEPARFDIFDDDREAESVVQRISDPMMLLRDITKVNSAMVIRHGVIAARIGRPADELKCLPRS